MGVPQHGRDPRKLELEVTMRRTYSARLCLAGLTCFVLPTVATAQESTTRGFNLGFHLSGASLKVGDDERSNAGGGGIVIGYGINRSLTLFAQFDGAEFDVENVDVEGRWTMGHGDLGVRYHFANSLRSWVPYLQAALSGRVVSVSDAVVNQQAETDVSFAGGALTLGGGLMVYLKQTLALDLQLAWSGGEFTEVSIGNLTLSGLNLEAQSSRFNVGLSWWP
jgi:hypothetical protein